MKLSKVDYLAIGAVFVIASIAVAPAWSSSEPDVICGSDGSYISGIDLPLEGYRRGLIVFVRFPDDNLADWTNDWPISPSAQNWDTLPAWSSTLCEDTNGSGAPATNGSLAHYFYLMSRGKFDFDSRTSGTVVVVDSSIAQYTHNGDPSYSGGTRAGKIAFDALKKLAGSTFDFSPFDTAESHVLDYVCFVFRGLTHIVDCDTMYSVARISGSGQIDQTLVFQSAYDGQTYTARGTLASWVNSAFSRVCTADYPNPVPAGGFSGCSSTCTPFEGEDRPAIPCSGGGSSTLSCPVGNRSLKWYRTVITHEMGHSIFTGDATVIAAGHTYPLNDWGLMHSNGHGSIMHGYERIAAGWVSPLDIVAGQTRTIRVYDSVNRNVGSWNPSINDSTYYRIYPDLNDLSEYFILENRRFSTIYCEPETLSTHRITCGQPGRGLLITHVHQGALGDSSSMACTNGLPKLGFRLAIEPSYGLFDVDYEPNPANGRSQITGGVGAFRVAHPNDPFYPGRNTTFAPYTCPNTNLYDATDTLQSVVSGLAIVNIREGPDSSLIAEVRWNQAANRTSGNVKWDGQVLLSDDFTISAEDTVTAESNARVLMGKPRLANQGVDTKRTEILIEEDGQLKFVPGLPGSGAYFSSSKDTTVRLAPKPDGKLVFTCDPLGTDPDTTVVTSNPLGIADWYGIRLRDIGGIFVAEGVVRSARAAIAMESSSFPDISEIEGSNLLDLANNFNKMSFDRDVYVASNETITVPVNFPIGFAANRDASPNPSGLFSNQAELLLVGDCDFQGQDYYNQALLRSDDPDSADAYKLGDWGGMRVFPLPGQECADSRELDFTMFRDATYGIAIVDTCLMEMNWPLFKNNKLADIYLDRDVRIPSGRQIDLRAPTRIVATSGSSNYDHMEGESGKVDIIVGPGSLITKRPPVAQATDWVTFESTVKDSVNGDDWGGIVITDNGTGHLEDIDAGFALRPVYFALADSALLLESRIHHYKEEAVVDGVGAHIESNSIAPGALFDPAVVNTGIHTASGGEITGNAIGQHRGYGIWFDGSEQFCYETISPTPTTDSLIVRGNKISGDGQGLNYTGSAGIYISWLCQYYAAVVEADTVSQWSGRGVHVFQSADIDFKCNKMNNNRVAMRYLRTGNKLQSFEGNVWLKQNEFKKSVSHNMLIDDIVGLKIYDRPNSGSRAEKNSFQRGNVIQTVKNISFTPTYDADLDAGKSSWLLNDGTVITDSTTIRSTIDVGIGDLFLSPILSSEDLCSGQGAFLAGQESRPLGEGHNPVEALKESSAPTEWAIAELHPNPTRGKTSIVFDVPAAAEGPVRIIVYDIAGRKVRTLVDDRLSPGRYQIDWSGQDGLGNAVRSGIYFVRLEGSGWSKVRKLVRLK